MTNVSSTILARAQCFKDFTFLFFCNTSCSRSYKIGFKIEIIKTSKNAREKTMFLNWYWLPHFWTITFLCVVNVNTLWQLLSFLTIFLHMLCMWSLWLAIPWILNVWMFAVWFSCKSCLFLACCLLLFVVFLRGPFTLALFCQSNGKKILQASLRPYSLPAQPCLECSHRLCHLWGCPWIPWWICPEATKKCLMHICKVACDRTCPYALVTEYVLLRTTT